MTNRPLFTSPLLLLAIALALGAVMLTLTGLQAARPAAPAATNSAPPGDFLRVHSAAPGTLDPALAVYASEASIIEQVYEGLVRLDEDFAVQPAIAGSWTTAPDASVYTFTLRPAYFSNGRRIIAGDVVTSFMRALSPTLNASYAMIFDDIQGAQAYRTGSITTPVGIQALDDNTVRLTLAGMRVPAVFLKKLSLPIASVMPIEEVAAGGINWWQSPARYIGAGPFRMTQFISNSQIVLEANPYYYGGAPMLRGIVFRFISSSDTAFAEYVADRLDVYGPPQSQGISITLAGIGSQFYSSTYASTNWAVLDNQKAPFTGTNGMKLRQALNYAVDKTQLISVAYGNFGDPAKGLLPPGLYGYSPTLQGLDFNVVSATQRLTESGYAGSPPLLMYSASATQKRILENVRDQIFTNLGFSATITTDVAANYQMRYRGWVADYPDPEDWLPILLRSGASFNWSHYSNAAFDALVDQAAQTITETDRIALYQQAEQLAVSEAAFLPLYHARTALLIKPWVKGNALFDWNWSRPYTNLRIESSAAVSVSASTVYTADANIVLQFPAGAVTQSATITYTALATRPLSLSGGYAGIGYAFDLAGVYSDGAPVGAFQTPVTLTLSYTVLQPVNELGLTLYTSSGGSWVPADICGGPWIDTGAHVFQVALCHFSRYTLAGQTQWLYLPLIRR